MLLKNHINKQKIDPPTMDQTKIAEPYLVINKNLFKKKERYRRKTKQNALKIITKVRESRAKLKRKAGEKLADLFHKNFKK